MTRYPVDLLSVRTQRVAAWPPQQLLLLLLVNGASDANVSRIEKTPSYPAVSIPCKEL